MSLPSLPVGRSTAFVASSYATMHGCSGRQPAAPSCGRGHVQGKGRTDAANAGRMPMAFEGAPPSPLYGLQLTAEVARLSTEVQSGGLPPPTFAREAVQVQERRQRGGHLPKLVPIEDGDLVHEVHHFSERANWLVPGKVLLGKYPGQIPIDLKREPDLQLARDRVLEIVLRGGATDLFCLQAELPPQDDDSRWDPPADERDNGSFFSGFRAYRGDAEAAVAAAAASAAATAAASATTTATATAERGSKREQGGNGGTTPELPIINGDAGAREEVGVGVGARGEGGLTFHHFPIPDLSPAENTEILSGLVDQLESLVASGKVPFIHCWAGRGRTGLIASCLLGRLYPELSAEQSLTRVDAYYRTRGTVAIGKTSRVSPETPEQEEQVRLFFKQVLKKR